MSGGVSQPSGIPMILGYQNIARPTALRVITVTSGNVPSDSFGILVNITYQIVDKHGNPVTRLGMIPLERLEVIMNGARQNMADAGGYIPLLGSDGGIPRAADHNGQFTDPIVENRNDVHDLTITAAQKIAIEIEGKTYKVRTNHFTIQSNVPGHGSISNGIHGDINASN